MIKETTYIYTLTDPRSGLVRYVGKSDSPNQRNHAHKRDVGCKTHKQSWIKGLFDDGFDGPIMNIIDEVPYADWAYWERQYIKMFKSAGAKLVNLNEGGVGPEPSRETRLKMSIAAKRKPRMSEETRMKIAASLRSKITPEHVLFMQQRSAEMRKKRGGPTEKQRLAAKRAGLDRKKAVLQYSKEGVFLKKFDGVRDAASETNVKRLGISNCCKGKLHYKFAGGYMWRFYSGTDIPPVIEVPIVFTCHKSVSQYDLSGNFIKKYDSAVQAAKEMLVTPAAIGAGVKKGLKIKGCIWKFTPNPEA